MCGWFNFIIYMIGVLVVSGGVGLLIGYLYSGLRYEARTRNKRIEFAAMMAGMLAAVAAAGSLVYSITQIEALTERVSALEKAAQIKPAPNTQPTLVPDRL